jgi:hypothetical protein
VWYGVYAACLPKIVDILFEQTLLGSIMMSSYTQTHWNRFLSIQEGENNADQGVTGSIPATWAKRLDLNYPEISDLPDQLLDRRQVRTICIDGDRHVLFGYACAMAWGGQGTYNRKHSKGPWDDRERLIDHLTRLRSGTLGRSDSYNLFRNEGRVYGLGPSFFTKLLYFFSPNPSSYIMDQWTAKSVNLLTGRCVVKMDGDIPSNRNTGDDYTAFCSEIDLMAAEMKFDGDKVEELLFSKGKEKGRPRGEWRNYVRDKWSQKKFEASDR